MGIMTTTAVAKGARQSLKETERTNELLERTNALLAELLDAIKAQTTASV